MLEAKISPASRTSTAPIDAGVRIGHVHLKVADLDRALSFYVDILGFEIYKRIRDEAAFISAGGYHHHIGLNTWQSKGGTPPPPGSTGLFHLAILYPTRASLADALRRLMKAGVAVDHGTDHGVSQAIYLEDFDGNGVELVWDRPRDQWPRSADGIPTMTESPLDLDDLLREPAI
ncbi:catechol 2,3-dioxygenase [Mesorhizobium soli]|uniref:VOC family protein n=1 Tax=Pseudaminobacter soli (ex Li et al. 2025) TaxID=1295366 RepID=UPI002472F72E|nr:VOC family protein [Mesorhizobium soli]MDH6232217.1 catechol 2,3-dioxygenase [Mesorhizobium soli]